jgi:phosphate/sulfate permease
LLYKSICTKMYTVYCLCVIIISCICIILLVWWCLTPLSTIFSYIVAVSFTGRENWSTRRKTQSCHYHTITTTTALFVLYPDLMHYLLYTYMPICCMTLVNKDKISAYVVTFIKQSPILKCHIFLYLSKKILHELNLF